MSHYDTVCKKCFSKVAGPGMSDNSTASCGKKDCPHKPTAKADTPKLVAKNKKETRSEFKKRLAKEASVAKGELAKDARLLKAAATDKKALKKVPALELPKAGAGAEAPLEIKKATSEGKTEAPKNTKPTKFADFPLGSFFVLTDKDYARLKIKKGLFCQKVGRTSILVVDQAGQVEKLRVDRKLVCHQPEWVIEFQIGMATCALKAWESKLATPGSKLP